jgi:hypothetical protein
MIVIFSGSSLHWTSLSMLFNLLVLWPCDFITSCGALIVDKAGEGRDVDIEIWRSSVASWN